MFLKNLRIAQGGALRLKNRARRDFFPQKEHDFWSDCTTRTAIVLDTCLLGSKSLESHKAGLIFLRIAQGEAVGR